MTSLLLSRCCCGGIRFSITIGILGARKPFGRTRRVVAGRCFPQTSLASHLSIQIGEKNGIERIASAGVARFGTGLRGQGNRYFIERGGSPVKLVADVCKLSRGFGKFDLDEMDRASPQAVEVPAADG